jgi:uncharacterized membrane protein
VAASAVLAGLAWAVGLVSGAAAAVVVAAAFLGTMFESYLGATTIRGGEVADNEAVNFVNTAVGGVTAIGMAWALGM